MIKEDIKLKNDNKDQRQCNQTLVSTQKPPHSAEVCALSAVPPPHDPCRGLFPQMSWHLSRGGSMGLPGRKLHSCLGLVASQILPGNANKPGKVQNMKWVPPETELSSVAASLGGLCFLWPFTWHRAKVPSQVVSSFQSSSSQTSRTYPPRDLHPYWKEEVISRIHSSDVLVWSSNNQLPQILGY